MQPQFFRAAKKTGIEGLDLPRGVENIHLDIVSMTPSPHSIALLIELKRLVEFFAIFKSLAERKREVPLVIGIAGFRLKPLANVGDVFVSEAKCLEIRQAPVSLAGYRA